MGRLAAMVACLVLAAAAARAAECIPFDKWRQALVDGDAPAVGKLIADGAANCRCASDQDNCLQLPSYSQLTSPAAWREASQRLLAWRAETFAQCGAMPESAPAEQSAKRKCFETRAAAISEGLAGETFGRAFSPIPNLMIEKLVKKLDAGGAAGPVSAQKTYTEEEQTIGRQICSLIAELDDAKDKVELVRRHKEGTQGRDRRIQELENEIRDLTATIYLQKQRFASLAGESWSPFPFCKPPDPGKK